MLGFEDVIVHRFAIDYKGPTLIVEYQTSAGKLFHRKIRFKRYPADADPKRVAKRLVKQFDDILGPERVSQEQLLELVNILLSATPMAAGGKPVFFVDDEKPIENQDVNNDVKYDDEFGDLNVVTEEENVRAKKTMDVRFAENSLKPGDDGYLYDKVVEFDAPSMENDWDDSD